MDHFGELEEDDTFFDGAEVDLGLDLGDDLGDEPEEVSYDEAYDEIDD